MTYSRKAKRLAIADTMIPADTTLYPASDIVSISNSGTAPTYPGGWNLTYNASDLDKRVLKSFTFEDLGGNGAAAINGADNTSVASMVPYQVEFYLIATQFTFFSVTVAESDFIIYVDDMPLTDDWVKAATAPYSANYYTIEFATNKVRRIRILASGYMSFTQLMFAWNARCWAAPQRLRCAVVGDSYIQGGHTDTNEGVINMGQGGTGYINDSGGANGRDAYGATSRINAMKAVGPLDLIIVYGGGNDSGASTGDITAAVNNYWNSLAYEFNGVPIVVIGVEPGSPNNFDPVLLESTNDIIRAQAALNPNVAGFIDQRPTGTGMLPWVTGTGNAGDQHYDGSADDFIGSDGVHPTREGYRNLVERTVHELRKIKV